jgi:hypothetical protein
MTITEEARTPGEVHTIPVPIKLVEKARTLTWSVSGDAYLGKEPEAELATEVDAGLLAAQRAAQATPAPSSPGVPDSVRALSEAATPGLWMKASGTDFRATGPNDTRSLGMTSPAGDGNGINDRAFIVAAVNFVRTLIAAHPAGQSTGEGADSALTATEAECDESYQIGKRDVYDEGVQDAVIRAGLDGEYRASSDPDRHVPDASTMPERIAERVDGLEVSLERANKPAPDSTRTGQVGTGWALVPAEPTQAMWAAFRNADAGSIAFTKAYHAMLAARPAAPEAQGAWQDVPDDLKPGEYIVEDDRWGVTAARLYDSRRWFVACYNGQTIETKPRRYQPMSALPAPPASSGQESAL